MSLFGDSLPHHRLHELNRPDFPSSEHLPCLGCTGQLNIVILVVHFSFFSPASPLIAHFSPLSPVIDWIRLISRVQSRNALPILDVLRLTDQELIFAPQSGTDVYDLFLPVYTSLRKNEYVTILLYFLFNWKNSWYEGDTELQKKNISIIYRLVKTLLR